MNEEVTEWLRGRSLDPERLNQAFALRKGVKNRRIAIRYPTPVGIDRVRFIDGEHPKYSWQRRGGKPHWYGLPQALDLLEDGWDGPLFVVNGEPSVWAAWQSSVPAVCTCGGESALPTKPQFERLAGLGRQIEIVYDADQAGERGSVKIAQVFLELGCDVVVRRWREFLDGHPDTADLEVADLKGFDVDDLHQFTGDDDLAAALKDLEILPVERADRPEPLRMSHWHLAETVLRRLQYRDGPDLTFDDGTFWRYEPSPGVWSQLTDTDFGLEVGSLDGFQFTDGEKVKTLSLSASAIDSIRRCAVIQSDDEGFFAGAPEGVQFRNGFLPADTMELTPSHPRHRQQFALEADFDPGASCPVWEAALRATFVGDVDAEDKVALLQEFAGAVLFGLTGKVLFLFGAGANGKSTVLDVISELVPDEARCSIAPHKLSSGHQAEYWVAQLAGRRLNVDADIPAGELLESSEFKKSVTGDELTGRDPAGKPFSFRPRVLHLFSANDLPSTRDHTKGFWRRILALEFRRDFEADPDTGVGPKLAILRRGSRPGEFGRELFRYERAGILAWAVRGARRLLERGEFTVPTSSATAKDEWRKISDQVAMFLHQECNTDVEFWTSASDLHEHYNTWARRTNHGPMSSTKFGLRMRALGFSEELGRKRRDRMRGIEYRVARLAVVDDELPF